MGHYGGYDRESGFIAASVGCFMIILSGVLSVLSIAIPVWIVVWALRIAGVIAP